MSRPLRIFLAEDNPGDVELVREALLEHNIAYELVLATDGSEVQRYLRSLEDAPQSTMCPDIVLLDLNLPKATGFELCALLRAHRLCSKIPVVILTSSSAPKDRERAAELGVARYFRKPSDLEEFMQFGAVIGELVRERGIPQGA